MAPKEEPEVAGAKISRKSYWFKFLLLMVIFFLGYLLFKDKKEYLDRLQNIPLHLIFVLILSQVAVSFVRANRLQIMTNYFGTRFPLLEAVLLTAANTMINLFPLYFGLLYKAVFFKQRLGMRYRDFTVLTGVGYLVTLLMGLVISLFLCFLLWFLLPIEGSLILGLSLMLLGLGSLWFFPDFFLKMAFIQKKERIRDVLNECKEMRKTPGFVLKLALNDVITISLVAFRLWIAFLALDFQTNYFSSLVIAATAQFSSLISFSPGALGIREALAGLIGGFFDISIPLTILAASLDRVTTLLFIIPVGLIGIYYLSIKIRKK